MKRLLLGDLLAIGEALAPREREALTDLSRFGLMTHRQLAALLRPPADSSASETSVARMTRRLLQRWTDLGLVARLERRIGGLRAGSSGFVYYLGPAGQRLTAFWQGRGAVRGRYRPEPGGRYVRHRLAVSELFVAARLAARRGDVELLDFDPEPDCWRSYADGLAGTHLLKPDAFVRVGIGSYEENFFAEVDLGTESRPVIARKLRAYEAYYESGREQAARGVFPRVLVLTNSAARQAALVTVCGQMPAERWRLFTVATLDRFEIIMSGKSPQNSGI